MKHTFLLAFVISICQYTQAQDTLIDPYASIKSFTTWELGLAATTIDGRSDEFGQYTLKTGKYYPTFNMGFFYTRANLLNEDDFFLNYKLGLLLNSNYTDLTDSLDNELRFTESNLTIPFMIGIRLPVQYNSPDDKFYKAVNMNIGAYVSFPFGPTLAEPGDRWAKSDDFFGDYIKFGLIAEIEFTALNAKGKGHRFGFRTMTDFRDVIKLDEQSGIRPAYVSMGVYYNICTY